MTYTG